MNQPEKTPNFENLPQAVALVNQRLDRIEQLLLKKADEIRLESDSLLTIQQAAELVNLKVPTLYALVSKQQMPFSKKNRRLYFDKTELISWARSGRKGEIL